MSDQSFQPPIRGRGASGDPANRFERISFERDPEFQELDRREPWSHQVLATWRIEL